MIRAQFELRAGAAARASAVALGSGGGDLRNGALSTVVGVA